MYITQCLLTFFLVIKALFMLLLNILPNEKKTRNYSKKKKGRKREFSVRRERKIEAEIMLFMGDAYYF